MRSPWTDPDKPGMQTALHLSVDRVPAIAAAVAVMREVHGAWSPTDSTPCGGCNCKLRASGRRSIANTHTSPVRYLACMRAKYLFRPASH